MRMWNKNVISIIKLFLCVFFCRPASSGGESSSLQQESSNNILILDIYLGQGASNRETRRLMLKHRAMRSYEGPYWRHGHIGKKIHTKWWKGEAASFLHTLWHVHGEDKWPRWVFNVITTHDLDLVSNHDLNMTGAAHYRPYHGISLLMCPQVPYSQHTLATSNTHSGDEEWRKTSIA